MADKIEHESDCLSHTNPFECDCGIAGYPAIQSPKVVAFPGENVQDIPRGLRDLAHELEFPPKAKTLGWVTISEDGTVNVGVLGICHDKTHAMGVFHRAIRALED